MSDGGLVARLFYILFNPLVLLSLAALPATPSVPVEPPFVSAEQLP